MKRTRIELALLFVALLLLPTSLMAQDDMSFGEDEVAAAEEENMVIEEDEADGTGETGSETGQEGASSESDILGALGEDLDVGGDATVGQPGEASGEGETVTDRHPIWAVQQVYALRSGRVDLQPSFGVSMNDPYMQHQSINLGAAYYITEVLAAGVSFNWYRFLEKETATNFSVSRATHQTVPINEYFWGGQINFTYVPLYGKFALAKEWILHWDVWILGGGGFIFTRPKPVIDPDFRQFDFSMKFCFNVGIGGRMFLTRFLAIFVELRDYIFPEELESLETYSNVDDRKDKKLWTDDTFKLTNNVMLHFGVSLFLPFTFDYKLPK